MTIEGLREGADEHIRHILESLPGVREVELGGYPGRVIVRCDTSGARELVAEAVRERLGAEAGLSPEVEVELVVPPSPRTHRARFESIEVRPIDAGRVRATVTLEWNDEPVVGEAEGELTLAGELRTCAMAAIRAVEKVATDEITFTLIGAKELHVFDHDLVAVLLQSAQFQGGRLMGTSIISEDRRRSAVLAVLSATNRAVGNYVEPPEG